MKMSDVFELPVTIREYGDQDYYVRDAGARKDGGDLGEFYAEATSSAAAHAINLHDELVEMLEGIQKDISDNGGSLAKLDELLAEARGD